MDEPRPSGRSFIRCAESMASLLDRKRSTFTWTRYRTGSAQITLFRSTSRWCANAIPRGVAA